MIVASAQRRRQLRFVAPPAPPQSPAWQLLDRQLPADHHARRIVQALAALDLRPLLDSYAGRGSLPYPPGLLLRIALIEIHEGKHSPTQWWRDTQRDQVLQWAGCGIRPSRTCWHHFHRRLAHCLDGFNRQVLQVGQQQHQLSGDRASLDGSTVAANASRHRLLNAERLDHRDTGTSSGSIAVLGSGGLLPTSTVPGGTNRDIFTIDADSSTTTPTLKFGATLAQTLLYNSSTSRFEFSDDVAITGNLTVSGLVNGVDITNLQTSTGALKAFSGGGLNLKVSGGSYRLNGNITNYAGGTVALPASSTAYVFFGSGGLVARTLAFPTDESYIPVAQVTTSAGAILTVSDRRAMSIDDREQTIVTTMNADFEKASYQGDATNNVGQLYTTFDNTNQRNYYLWTSTKSSLQDYNITLRLPLSSDFTRWKQDSTTNPLSITCRIASSSGRPAKSSRRNVSFRSAVRSRCAFMS